MVRPGKRAPAARAETGRILGSGRPVRLGLPGHVFAEDLEGPVEAAWQEAVDRLTTARTEWVPVDRSPPRSAATSMNTAPASPLPKCSTRPVTGHRGHAQSQCAATGPAYAGPAALRGAVAERRAVQAA